jgi:hypothetical protein
VILFEATGDTGVTLTDWHDFIDFKWDKLYHKIVFRKLYCERPPEMLEALEAFIKVT